MNPLGAADLAVADQIVVSMDDALAFLAKCTDCGMDVAALAAQAQALREFGLKVKQNFGAPTGGKNK